MCLSTTKSIIGQSNKMAVFPLLNGTYQLEIYNSIREAEHRWSVIAPANNDFLQIPYFHFLEQHPPRGLSFRYLVFTQSDTVIGIALCQLVQLRVGDALTDNDIPGYQQKVNEWILKLANMNAIINGNLLLTGDYGSYFDSSVTSTIQYQLIDAGLHQLKSELKKQSHATSLIILKDVANSKQNQVKSSLGKQYNEFVLQPNMVLPLLEEWDTFESYLGDMTSKARTRAKRAFKALGPIEKKEFNLDLLDAFLPQIDKLYKAIADKAGFNVVYLDGHYFRAFKEHFPEKFRVYGYFLNNELLAFYTTFKNHHELEAHYLGIDAQSNRTYQLYLNILFDIIRIGLDSKVEHINFARTALEIKSSVGAQPQELYFYGNYTNPLKNQVFSPVLAYFQPTVDWKPRNPFKKKSS